MIRNYLLILRRNLIRQFTYSFINIAGLAIGLSCSLVIFLYVYGEWSHDRGFENGDRVYRIGVSFFNIGNFATGPEQLLHVLPGEFAGIETATRIQKEREFKLLVHDQEFRETVYFTDTAYFHVFKYSFTAGDGKNVLRGPNEIVLTTAMAMKLFGREDVIGQTVMAGNDKTAYTITGIVRPPAFTTHLTSGIFLSMQGRLTNTPTWSSAAFYNYVLLRPGITEGDLHAALARIMEKHVYPESGKPMGFSTLQQYLANENSVKFYVHRFTDVYLKSKLTGEISPGGSEDNIYFFTAISSIILLLATVNFVNLTTARASRRAKEVGLRKTMGTTRGHLIFQFLVESVLTTSVAMFIALGMSEMFLVLFEYITGSQLEVHLWSNPIGLFLYGAGSMVVGLVAGIYPAFYLTSFVPSKVLKGNVTGGGSVFRNFLVIFQFSVSVVLIISTVVVVQQLRFIQTTDLGFDQENVVTIDQAKLLGTSAQAFRDELSRLPGVTSASFHAGEPGSKRRLTFMMYKTAVMTEAATINTYMGDADYCTLMGFRIIQGRTFMRDVASDSSGIILNEAAVKLFGLGDNPIGAAINGTSRVIGVVSDFHWESLRNKIGPTAIVLANDQARWELSFKLDGRSAAGFLKSAETRWKQMVPQEVFRYHFVDGNFGELVAKEAIFGKAITFFTVLAILISCLGLYGLSAFTTSQRTREIGIRKVLGADVPTIMFMLTKKFATLVLIAIVIAVPVSALLMTRWLEGFAYRVSMDAGTFVFSAGTALVIALLTVTGHSMKAAVTDPAKTLKYE